MEIKNDDLARVLGRMEAKLDALAEGSKRTEQSVADLGEKVDRRLEDHDRRIRQIEVANPAKIAETVASHAKRLEALEKGQVKTGTIAGVGAAVVVAAIIEAAKRKLGG